MSNKKNINTLDNSVMSGYWDPSEEPSRITAKYRCAKCGLTLQGTPAEHECETVSDKTQDAHISEVHAKNFFRRLLKQYDAEYIVKMFASVEFE